MYVHPVDRLKLLKIKKLKIVQVLLVFYSYHSLKWFSLLLLPEKYSSLQYINTKLFSKRIYINDASLKLMFLKFVYFYNFIH